MEIDRHARRTGPSDEPQWLVLVTLDLLEAPSAARAISFLNAEHGWVRGAGLSFITTWFQSRTMADLVRLGRAAPLEQFFAVAVVNPVPCYPVRIRAPLRIRPNRRWHLVPALFAAALVAHLLLLSLIPHHGLAAAQHETTAESVAGSHDRGCAACTITSERPAPPRSPDCVLTASPAGRTLVTAPAVAAAPVALALPARRCEPGVARTSQAPPRSGRILLTLLQVFRT